MEEEVNVRDLLEVFNGVAGDVFLRLVVPRHTQQTRTLLFEVL
jgi:hypothetical protein